MSLLLLSCQVMAAGLGRMSVMSGLGQPLKAEIELLSVQADEIGAVEAKLASAEAFRQARIARSATLSDLQLSVDKRANGQPVVRLTTASPVNDPFVDLLIELNWNSGRILREYTVLLDPVRDQKAEEAPRPAPALATVTEPAARAEPAKVAPTVAPAKPAAPEPAQAPARSYGPVKAGETLRGIAAKVLPADVTLDMMVASLYQANRKAFADGNLNMLKQGQVLAVPDRESVMLMHSPHQARQLINQHDAAWHELRGRLADQAARSVAEPAAEPAGKGKIVPAKPAAKPTAEAAKDVLKLSKGEPAKTADAKPAQRIQALEEELAAKSRALQEAQDRVNQLERTVQDLQRLMDLKAKNGDQKPAEPAAATPPAAAPAAEPAPAKPAVTPPVAIPAEEPGFFASLLANPLYIGGALAAVVLAGLLWVFMIGSRRRKGLSDFEQSVMTGGDQFKTSIFKTGTGAPTERSTATQSGVATDFSRLGLGSIDTHEVDPIAEAEVYMAYGRDAQAEEILKEALSKDPNRHEIVLKLLEIYATRQDAASFETQASELYANLGDPASPVWHQAAEMGRKLDPANPLYRVFSEVPTLPEVPAAVPEMEAVAEPAVEPVAEAAEPAMAEPVEEQPVEEQPAVAEFAFEMPVEFEPEPAAEPVEAEMTPVAESAVAELTGEFELPEDLAEAEKSYPSFGLMAEAELAAAEPIAMPAEETETALELPEEFGPLDLAPEMPTAVEAMPDIEELTDLSALELPEPVALPEAEKLPDLDFSGIDLDLSEPEEIVAQPVVEEPALEAPSEIDPDLLEEVNTKLDLARAYMEMGDKEGAREILDEVVKEGDSRQKQEAEKLIAGL